MASKNDPWWAKALFIIVVVGGVLCALPFVIIGYTWNCLWFVISIPVKIAGKFLSGK